MTERNRYHKKLDGILRIRPDGKARFLTPWERVQYALGMKP